MRTRPRASPAGATTSGHTPPLPSAARDTAPLASPVATQGRWLTTLPTALLLPRHVRPPWWVHVPRVRIHVLILSHRASWVWGEITIRNYRLMAP